ncbi:hypothetical protein LP420_21035 [Massilia sp. B-10]|nr:hypothetical protein LP420_21035 [Massilia sp. B-10]
MIGYADNDPIGEMVAAACEAQGVHPVFRTVVQTYQIAFDGRAWQLKHGRGRSVHGIVRARRQGAAPPLGPGHSGQPVPAHGQPRAAVAWRAGAGQLHRRIGAQMPGLNQSLSIEDVGACADFRSLASIAGIGIDLRYAGPGQLRRARFVFTV